MTRHAAYDANGDQLHDTDVLSPDELAEDRARHRLDGGRHSYQPPRTHVFPAIDAETGMDAEGCQWGARTYGGAS